MLFRFNRKQEISKKSNHDTLQPVLSGVPFWRDPPRRLKFLKEVALVTMITCGYLVYIWLGGAEDPNSLQWSDLWKDEHGREITLGKINPPIVPSVGDTTAVDMVSIGIDFGVSFFTSHIFTLCDFTVNLVALITCLF